MSSTLEPLVVHVSEDTRQQIAALAKARGRGVDDVLNEAIERYLAEDQWISHEIAEAVNEADSPDAIFYTTAEVMRHLDDVISRARTRKHAS